MVLFIFYSRYYFLISFIFICLNFKAKNIIIDHKYSNNTFQYREIKILKSYNLKTNMSGHENNRFRFSHIDFKKVVLLWLCKYQAYKEA